jgi:hypothetical protein
MNARTYYLISGIIFACVSLAHLVRVVQGWPVNIAHIDIPVYVSVCGCIIPGLMAIWAFRLYNKT